MINVQILNPANEPLKNQLLLLRTVVGNRRTEFEVKTDQFGKIALKFPGNLTAQFRSSRFVSLVEPVVIKDGAVLHVSEIKEPRKVATKKLNYPTAGGLTFLQSNKALKRIFEHEKPEAGDKPPVNRFIGGLDLLATVCASAPRAEVVERLTPLKRIKK